MVTLGHLLLCITKRSLESSLVELGTVPRGSYPASPPHYPSMQSTRMGTRVKSKSLGLLCSAHAGKNLTNPPHDQVRMQMRASVCSLETRAFLRRSQVLSGPAPLMIAPVPAVLDRVTHLPGCLPVSLPLPLVSTTCPICLPSRTQIPLSEEAPSPMLRGSIVNSFYF